MFDRKTVCFALCIYASLIGQTYAVSLADLINNGGSTTSGDVTFSNFTGTFSRAPSSLIPPEGCCHFPTLADITIQPSTRSGFTINGIELSGSWSTASTPASPSQLWYQLLLGYDVTVDGSQTLRRMEGAVVGPRSVTVVGVFLTSGSQSVRTFFPDFGQVSSEAQNISGSFFHVNERVDVLPLGGCSIGPPSPVPLGGCSFVTSASIANSFTAVPEPSTALLLITGLVAEWVYRKKAV